MRQKTPYFALHLVPAPLLVLAALAAGASSPALAQSGDLIRMDATRIERAGIVLQTASRSVPPGAAAGQALRLSGTVILPTQSIEVMSSLLDGVVQAILVAPMQAVRAGQPVVRLHSQQLLVWQRDYVQAASQARLAGAKLKRDEQLYAEGIIAESRLQEARSAATERRVAARERRQSLRLAGMGDAALDTLAATQTLSPTVTLAAPVSGMVNELNVSLGQRLGAGAPILQIAKPGRLWIELLASQQQAQQIKVGDALSVAGCKTPAQVIAIAPQLNASTQSMLVRAERISDDTCLRPNQYVEATLAAQAAPEGALALPDGALVRHGGKVFVFVREPAGFRAVPVTLLPQTDGRNWVRGAIRPDAQIAVSGTAAIKGAWLGLGAEARIPAAGSAGVPAKPAPQATPRPAGEAH